MNFNVNITPSEGVYEGAKFQFTVQVGENYPFEPPIVRCNTLVYHPNINYEGKVCMDILRMEWKPVMTLGNVIFGLMVLFLEPNPDDPLNKEAAKSMIQNYDGFVRDVRDILKGGYKFEREFPVLI